MREVNLLDSYPKIKRPIRARERSRPLQREVARRFGQEYFDGDRTQGYGGYHYDGRWIPVAKHMQEFYGLTREHRILDVGCAKGFLLSDLQRVIPGVRIAGLDVSAYAIEHAMDGVKPFLVIGTADQLPFPDKSFDLVISVNTIHNLELARCKQAIREMERVSRAHKYLQVDSFLTEEQRQNFERWQLTALTYFSPEVWRRLFHELRYTGDYYWTITE
ncbi:MAG TPA: class I SAM-dependent methyltransferase [bacterium]|nr:class I SAM-dependent methyltransferase [bacterium]